MDRIAFVVPFGFPTNTNNEKMNSQENDEEEYFVINDGVIEMDEEDNQNNTKKPEPQPAPGKLEALPIIIRFGGGEMEKVGHIAPLDPLYGLPNHGFLSEKRRVLQKKGVPKPPPTVYTGCTRNTMSIHPRPKTMENLQEERGEGPFLESQFSELVDSKTTNYFDFLGYIGNSFVGSSGVNK